MRSSALLFLCLGLLAQSQQPPDPSTLARLEGRVVNSVTGEPLRKAEISVLSGEGRSYSATSDAGGNFAIERVAPGTYSLNAQHQNFALAQYGATRAGAPGTKLNLTAGQSMTGLEVKLTPFGVISGKVVDQDGDPVSNVPITVMKWGYMRGSRQLVPTGQGMSTNDRGEYRVFNLSSGRYFVMARPMASQMNMMFSEPSGKRTVARPEPPRETFAPTFYPSSTDAAAAAPVQVSAGQEAPGIDIQLRKTRSYTVQGRVAGVSQGRRATIALQPRDAASWGFGLTRGAAVGQGAGQGDAIFLLRGVTPGLYDLIAMVDNRVAGRQEISVGDNDVEGLVVTVTDTGSVKGRVRFEETGTASPPSVTGLRVSLTPVQPVPANMPNANTSEDGSFAMDQVSTDRYKVNCSPVQGAYLKSIRWNGQVSNDGIVEVSGSGAATLDLVFGITTAQIEGDVKTADDQPAAGARVLLVPASGREADLRVVMADQNGHFLAKSVAPGGYTALAPDADIYGIPDPELLKALAKESATVTVDENGHATTALKLIPAATIEAAQ